MDIYSKSQYFYISKLIVLNLLEVIFQEGEIKSTNNSLKEDIKLCSVKNTKVNNHKGYSLYRRMMSYESVQYK